MNERADDDDEHSNPNPNSGASSSPPSSSSDGKAAGGGGDPQLPPELLEALGEALNGEEFKRTLEQIGKQLGKDVNQVQYKYNTQLIVPFLAFFCFSERGVRKRVLGCFGL